MQNRIDRSFHSACGTGIREYSENAISNESNISRSSPVSLIRQSLSENHLLLLVPEIIHYICVLTAAFLSILSKCTKCISKRAALCPRPARVRRQAEKYLTRAVP